MKITPGEVREEAIKTVQKIWGPFRRLLTAKNLGIRPDDVDHTNTQICNSDAEGHLGNRGCPVVFRLRFDCDTRLIEPSQLRGHQLEGLQARVDVQTVQFFVCNGVIVEKQYTLGRERCPGRYLL